MLHLQWSPFVSSPSSSSTTTSSSSSATISSFCSRSSQRNSDSIRFPATNFSRSLSVHFPRGILLRCKIEWSGSRFCCKASISSGSGKPSDSSQKWDDDEQFIQASLLVTETIRHYNIRKRGFLDETKWYSSGEMLSPSLPTKGPISGGSSFSHGFLRRFPNPTLFLKVACEGELILPIVVGEFAIQNLINTSTDDQPEECPYQFQFMKNLVGVLGYEVKKVWITKRVANTYHAQIFLGKTAGAANVSIDSRPSDAINVASEFKAPIYVSRKIVLKDAIRIIYGTQRKKASKTIYDVFLDSATEGPDHLTEELDLVKKMNTAIMEERYNDAAMWRDKLTTVRMLETES